MALLSVILFDGATDLEQPMQWWDAWDGASGGPRLVRLRVEFPARAL